MMELILEIILHYELKFGYDIIFFIKKCKISRIYWFALSKSFFLFDRGSNIRGILLLWRI